MNIKAKTARLSIFSNLILILLKLIVGLFTGSVSIISEAIHSTMDLAAALIAFFSVKILDLPPDEKHPYGHGKVENISGVIEALLILIAAIWIVVESIRKIQKHEGIQFIGTGFIIMIISAGVNYVVSKQLFKIAKQEDSVALEADALHLKADVYTSLGIGIGLFFIWITGISYLDPVFAIGVAIFIIKEAIELLKTAFNPLLDVTLSKEDIDVIKEIIETYQCVYCDFHERRTRKTGKMKYIDLHSVFHRETSVEKVHDLCSKIEKI